MTDAAAAGLQDDWQSTLKRFFIIPLILGNISFVVIGAIAGWWGPVVAASGQFLLFGIISSKRTRRVNAAPALALGVVGVVISFTESAGSAVVALLALALLCVYAFWYSKNGRTASAALAIGAALPKLSFNDLDGVAVHSSSWAGSPTVLLFYRGTWCPLCNVQVKELAEGYREIEALGARVVLVSPQPASESAKMAAKFDAPMTFLVDKDNAAARRLGIQHPGGAPIGIAPEVESVLPTAVVLDADGIVRFAHETDDYRFRPDPELFLATLRDLQPS